MQGAVDMMKPSGKSKAERTEKEMFDDAKANIQEGK